MNERIKRYWRVAADLRAGMTYRKIAEKYKISLGTVSNIAYRFKMSRRRLNTDA